MIPIYFPFTYISKAMGKALAACFGQTTVYQISGATMPNEMREMVDMDILEIRLPIEDTGEEFDTILKGYRRWAKNYRTSEFAFLKAAAGKIPFFDETATSQIRNDIRRTGENIPLKEKSDPLFNARLFLFIAQEFDLHQDRLARDLIHVESMEQDIMKKLKGENGDIHETISAENALGKDDPGHYMPHERLDAWASLMQYDKQGSGLFVTGSRSIVEHLLDMTPEMEFVVNFNAVPVLDNRFKEIKPWQEDLMKNLEMLASVVWLSKTDGLIPPPEIPVCEKKVSLSFYILPGKTPEEFFVGVMKKGLFFAEHTKNIAGFKNTIIGLVE